VKPYYEEKGITIYHGDCRAFLGHILDVDVFVTDPPYGVEFGSSDSRGYGHRLAKQGYLSYVDSYENWSSLVPDVLRSLITHSKRGCAFTGKWLTELPAPSVCGGIYCPAGVGRNPWGFTNLMTVFFCGSAPRVQFGASHTVLESTETAPVNGHPCPKPEGWMRWLVKLASLENEVVLDPFMGSGTTLRAAKDLGRRAIGIEIEEKYCEIAVKRLSQGVLEFSA